MNKEKCKKLNIVRLVWNFPQKVEGGLAPNIFYISKEQVKQGHNVYIFSLSPNLEDFRNIDGVNIYWIKKPHLVRLFGGLKLILQVKKALRKAPDIIHGLQAIPFGWLFPISKILLKSKYVLSVHNSIEPLKKSIVVGLKSKWDSFEYSSLIKFLAKRVDLVLPIASFIKDELITSGIKQSKIKIIPVGVDYDLFHQKESGNKNNYEYFRILYVGRFVQKKGLSYLIKAINIIRNQKIKLTLIGGQKKDNDYDNVINCIKNLNLEKYIDIKPSVPYSKLPAIYHQHDLFVLPSIMEPFGKVVLEAWNAGIPVIATNQGGIKDFVIDNYNGLLVSSKNEKEIAQKVKLIINNKKLKEDLIKNSSSSVKNFYWNNIAIKYSDSFLNISN